MLLTMVLREPPKTSHYLPLIAETLVDERTNIAPSDSAGVAISSSPIELVARCLNVAARGDDQDLAVLVRQVDLAVGRHRRRAEAAADLRQALPIDFVAGLQIVGVEHAVVRRGRTGARRKASGVGM